MLRKLQSSSEKIVTKGQPIDGLVFYENFITTEEARALLTIVNITKFAPPADNLTDASVCVVGYGDRWNNAIPSYFESIAQRLCDYGFFPNGKLPGFIHIVRYQVGGSIKWHKDDKKFGEFGACLTLLDVGYEGNVNPPTVEFRHEDNESCEADVIVPALHGSLYAFRGQAMNACEHRAAPATHKRYSINFRQF